MAVVTELVTRFGFAGSLEPLTQFNQGMKTAITGVAAFGAAFVTAIAGVARFGDAQLRSAQSLVTLSRNSGVALRSIQELEFAAQATGAASGVLTSGLDSINQAIGDASINGSEVFSRLGISIRDNVTGELLDAENVLLQVSDAFSGGNFTRAQQLSFANQLGLDASTLELLNLSRQEIRDLRKEASDFLTLNEDQANQIQEYNQAVGRLSAGWDQLKLTLAVGLAPVLQGLADDLADFVKSNPQLIEQISDAFSVAIDILKDYGTEIGLAIGAFVGIKVVFPILATLGRLLTGPLGILTALVTTWNSFIDGINGGDTVVRRFFKQFGVDIAELRDDILSLYSLFGLSGNTFQQNVEEARQAREITAQQQAEALRIINTNPAFQTATQGVTINNEINQTISTNDAQTAADRSSAGFQRALERSQGQLQASRGL